MQGMRSMHGIVPVGLCRLQLLYALCLHRNSLWGPAAPFSATLAALALHENMLSEVPAAAPLTLAHPQIFGLECPLLISLHRNRLSCRLPTVRGGDADMSVVALGNHFQYPENGFPESIGPHERSALFYVRRNECAQFLLQLGSVVCLAFSVGFLHLVRSSQVLHGHNRCSRLVLRATSLRRSTSRTCLVLTVFSCSLPLRLAIASPHFRCPSFYVRFSSVFSSSGTARLMLTLAWMGTSMAFARCEFAVVLGTDPRGQSRGDKQSPKKLSLILLLQIFVASNFGCPSVRELQMFAQYTDFRLSW